MPDDDTDDSQDIPGLDPSRFAASAGIVPLKFGRSVDNLTDAERKDNEEHDRIAREN